MPLPDLAVGVAGADQVVLEDHVCELHVGLIVFDDVPDDEGGLTVDKGAAADGDVPGLLHAGIEVYDVDAVAPLFSVFTGEGETFDHDILAVADEDDVLAVVRGKGGVFTFAGL